MVEGEPDCTEVRVAVLERALPPPSLCWRLRDMNAIRIPSTEVVNELAQEPLPLTIFARHYTHRFMHEALLMPNVALVEVSSARNPRGFDPHVDMGLPVTASDAEIEQCAHVALDRKKERYDYLHGLGMVSEHGSLILSHSERLLLNQLLCSRDSVVLKENLARALWGVAVDNAMSTSRAIDTLVYRLRRKLTCIPDLDIETVRSRGFRLIGKDSRAAQQFRTAYRFQNLAPDQRSA
jgi:DNA-binding winged helix-turn-helix (wHTH) protein